MAKYILTNPWFCAAVPVVLGERDMTFEQADSANAELQALADDRRWIPAQTGRFRNHVNKNNFDRDDEVNNLPSLTIPDETMSIREIMERYARGLPIAGSKVPVYRGEDDDVPDLEHMDLADREAYAVRAKEELQAIGERQKAREGQERKRKAVEESQELLFEEEEKPKEVTKSKRKPKAKDEEEAEDA